MRKVRLWFLVLETFWERLVPTYSWIKCFIITYKIVKSSKKKKYELSSKQTIVELNSFVIYQFDSFSFRKY